MGLFARLWTGFVQLINVATLSPFDLDTHGQAPLAVSNTFQPGHTTTVTAGYPVFTPPGAQPDSEWEGFKCEYPDMIGWEYCGRADRTCWLKNSHMGQFDINTNYEALRPHGIVRNYTLNVADGTLNTDGQWFNNAKLFNDIYPGPWIQACWGDVLNITVVNNLKWNGTAVHWHGLRQYLTMHMDGVPGVTQCPIAPGDSFSYIINTTQYGSSWYHSHYSLQYADGLAGPITIHGPSSAQYDEPAEIPLLMTDWSHWSMFQNDDLVNGTVLLNGKGNITRFGCKNPNDPKDPKLPLKPPVPCVAEPGAEIPEIETLYFNRTKVHDKVTKDLRPRRYLLRIINTSFETQFVFSIDNHPLQVISADFVPVQPYTTNSLLVGIGQRYNVIVEVQTKNSTTEPDKPDDFWIRTSIARCFKHYSDNKRYLFDGYDVTGILSYRAKGHAQTPETSPWDDISLDCKDEPAENLVPIVPWVVGPPSNIPGGATGQERDVTLNTEDKKHENLTYPMALFSLERPHPNKFNPLRVNYTEPIFFHLNETNNYTWPTPWVVIPENGTDKDWIYLLIEGDRTKNLATTGAHPIHLHGHDFAILKQSYWGHFRPGTPLNTANPARRDVVLLPQNGWVMIAFKADNPGNWLMHCHIAGHASFGLGAQILERKEDADAIWPHPSDGSANYCDPNVRKSKALCRASEVCDKWKAWENNCSNWWSEKGQDPCAYKAKPYYFLPDSGV